MVFIDASAMIAMLAEKPDALELVAKMEGKGDRLCSAISLWEAIAGLCRSYTFSVESARLRINALCDTLGIGEREFEIAAQAYRDFGKGRHPAALNMGDCFAYACAKANRAELLFQGDDFTKTDIPAA